MFEGNSDVVMILLVVLREVKQFERDSVADLSFGVCQ